jgi:hypothetical protein
VPVDYLAQAGRLRQVSGGAVGWPRMARLLHELWESPEGLGTFCLAGPDGDGARALLEPGSKLVWTVEADSHFEAMSLYYARMGWGPYTTEHERDRQPYPQEWLARQKR